MNIRGLFPVSCPRLRFLPESSMTRSDRLALPTQTIRWNTRAPPHSGSLRSCQIYPQRHMALQTKNRLTSWLGRDSKPERSWESPICG